MSRDDVNLPEGWEGFALVEVADVTMGQSPPGSTYNVEGNGLPFFQGKSEFGEDYPTTRKWCTAPTRLAEPGDILMSVRAPVGPTNVANQKCAVGRGLAVIRAHDGVPPSLIRHAIKYQESEIASWGTGTTFTAISRRHFQDIRVVLPPPADRELLASALDCTLLLRRRSTLHVSIARRAIERFRQAVIAAACSGRLTAEWRQSQAEALDDGGALPVGWEGVALGEMASSIRGGSTEVPSNGPSDYPILRSSSVRPFHVDYDDVRYLEPDQSSRAANFLEDGDLLITRLSGSIEYVGNCALVQSLHGRRIQYPDRLFCCRLTDPRKSAYVELFLAGPAIRRHIERASRSAAGHQRISISDLKTFVIARPPLQEQDEIVARTKHLLNLADSLLLRVEAASRQVERSDQAVLAKAFRGDLSVGSDVIDADPVRES